MAVEVEWIDSTSPQATGNKIYRDTVPSTGEVEIADIANGVQFYSDDTVAPGTDYKFEVQAHDGAGDETTQEVEGENMDYITTAGGLVNLCENGTFIGNDQTGWSFPSGWAITGEELVATNTTALATYTIPTTLLPSTDYNIKFEITASTLGNGVNLRIGGSGDQLAISGIGPKDVVVTTPAMITENTFMFDDNGGSISLAIDDVEIYQV